MEPSEIVVEGECKDLFKVAKDLRQIIDFGEVISFGVIESGVGLIASCSKDQPGVLQQNFYGACASLDALLLTSE